MTLNLIWPRAAVYNAAPPFHWYLRWGAVLFVGIIALGGFAYYWLVQRRRTGVLAEHAAASAAAPAGAAAAPEPEHAAAPGPGRAPAEGRDGR